MTTDRNPLRHFVLRVASRGIPTACPALSLIYWFCRRTLVIPSGVCCRGLVAQLLAAIRISSPGENDAGRFDHIGDLTWLLLWFLEAQLKHSAGDLRFGQCVFLRRPISRQRPLLRLFGSWWGFARRARAPRFRLLLTSPTRAIDVCNSGMRPSTSTSDVRNTSMAQCANLRAWISEADREDAYAPSEGI